MAKSKRLSKALKKLKEEQIAWTPEPVMLLHPNIPKPMHGVAPREFMTKPEWNQIRKASYRSTNYHCLACSVHKLQAKGHKWLEAHEVYDVDYLLGRMVYVRTVPLCNYCHSFIHSGRLANTSHPSKQIAVLKHGFKILREAKLNPSESYDGPFADWADWRLVYNSQEYPPKFKTFEQWKKAFP